MDLFPFGKKKKFEDVSKKIANSKDEDSKLHLCEKQVEFFKHKQKKQNFKFDYSEFLRTVRDLLDSPNAQCKKAWLKLVNEIMILDPSYKSSLQEEVFLVIFSKNFDDPDIKFRTIDIMTSSPKGLNFSEEITKKIIYFLTFDCLMKVEKLETLTAINKLFSSMSLNETTSIELTYLLDFAIEVFSLCTLQNICNYNEMEKVINKKLKDEKGVMYTEINEKINVYSEIFEHYLKKKPKIKKKILDQLLLILCFCMMITKEKALFLLIKNKDFFSNQVVHLLDLNQFDYFYLCDKDILKKYEKITATFICNFSKEEKEKYLSTFNGFKMKIGQLHEKMKAQQFNAIRGALEFLLRMIPTTHSDNKININLLLDYLNELKKVKDIKDLIPSVLFTVIDHHSSKLSTEWETLDLIIADFPNEYERFAQKLLFLKCTNKYQGRQTLFKQAFIRCNGENEVVMMMKMKFMLNTEENFLTNIEQLINDISGSVSISIKGYFLNLISLFAQTGLLENIILKYYNLLFNNFSLSRELKKKLINIIKASLSITSHMDFFQKIIQKITVKPAEISIIDYKFYQQKILYKLIKSLNETHQIEKLNHLFEVIETIARSIQEKTDDPFMASIIYLLEHSFFYYEDEKDENSDMFVAFGSRSKEHDFFKKKSFVRLVKEKSDPKPTSVSEITLNVILARLFEVLASKSSLSGIERILGIFSNNFFFFKIDIFALVLFVMNLIEEELKRITQSPLILKYSEVILINCIPYLKEKSLIKLNIIKSLITQIANCTRSKLSDAEIVTNIPYVKTFLTILRAYLSSIKTTPKKKNYFKSSSYPIVISQSKNEGSKERNEIIKKILKIIFDLTRISSLKPGFVIVILNFLFLSKDFFSCTEEGIIKIVYLLGYLVFPDSEDKLFDQFNSKFSLKNFQKISRKPLVKKNINKQKFISFFSEILVHLYVQHSGYSYELYKIFLETLDASENKRIAAFLSLLKWEAYYKDLPREIGKISTRNAKKKTCNYIGKNVIISVNEDSSQTIRTPISYQSFKLTNDTTKPISEEESKNYLNSAFKVYKEEDDETEQKIYSNREREDNSSFNKSILESVNTINKSPFTFSSLSSSNSVEAIDSIPIDSIISYSVYKVKSIPYDAPALMQKRSEKAFMFNLEQSGEENQPLSVVYYDPSTEYLTQVPLSLMPLSSVVICVRPISAEFSKINFLIPKEEKGKKIKKYISESFSNDLVVSKYEVRELLDYLCVSFSLLTELVLIKQNFFYNQNIIKRFDIFNITFKKEI